MDFNNKSHNNFYSSSINLLTITKQSPKKVLRLNKLYLKDIFINNMISFCVSAYNDFLFFNITIFFENEIGNFVGEIVNTPYWIFLLLVAVFRQ